jgi:ADP-ribose pyrophosphatase YjhB (NUDIX family)
MKISFCIECGGALTAASSTEYRCPNGHIYWNNPRAAASLLLAKDGKILFALRKDEPAKGKYDLPGGFVEQNETADAAAIRELYEETGINAKNIEYVTSVANNYTENTYTCDLIYVATEWDGNPTAADDAESLEWHDPELVDSDQFAWPQYRGVGKRIKTYLEGRDVS